MVIDKVSGIRYRSLVAIYQAGKNRLSATTRLHHLRVEFRRVGGLSRMLQILSAIFNSFARFEEFPACSRLGERGDPGYAQLQDGPRSERVRVTWTITALTGSV
jgi:hypothetical protein